MELFGVLGRVLKHDFVHNTFPGFYPFARIVDIICGNCSPSRLVAVDWP